MPSRCMLAAGCLWVALVVASALAGCSGQNDEEQVADAVQAMQDHMAAGDFDAVCAAMTARPKRQIGTIGHGRRPTTCPRDVREMVLTAELQAPGDGLRDSKRPAIRSVRVDPSGERALAVLTVDGGAFHVELAKEDGEWKLDDFFGAVAPPLPDLR